MGNRSGSRFITAKVDGIKALNHNLSLIAQEDLNVAKRELRQGTKDIANRLLIPELQRAAATSSSPLAARMAATARTRTDRFVTVAIGRVNPKLSGFKSGKASNQRWRTALAWGSDLGPHPASPVNHYGIGRNETGWWARSTVTATDTWLKVRDAYRDLLVQLLRDYGAFR